MVEMALYERKVRGMCLECALMGHGEDRSCQHVTVAFRRLIVGWPR